MPELSKLAGAKTAVLSSVGQEFAKLTKSNLTTTGYVAGHSSRRMRTGSMRVAR
jgi:hypothetical protein